MTSSSFEDKGELFRRIQTRLTAHPYAPIHREVELLRTVLGGVYLRNAVELQVLLNRAGTDTAFALELMRSDGGPELAEEFGDSVQPRLHNYLAGEYSLVQHVHIIANNRAKKLQLGSRSLAAAWDAKKREIPPPPEYAFMKDLRRYTQHMSLPVAVNSMSWSRESVDGPTMSHGVYLDAELLRNWSGEKSWTAGVRAFLKEWQRIDLRVVVQKDIEYTSSLNIWFYNSFAAAVQPLLDDYNELQAEFEAVRTGVTQDEARIVLKQRAKTVAYPKPPPSQ